MCESLIIIKMLHVVICDIDSELQKLLKERGYLMNGQVFKSGAHNIDPTKGNYMNEMMNTSLCLNLKGVAPECYR
jgi:hypothetical protein